MAAPGPAPGAAAAGPRAASSSAAPARSAPPTPPLPHSPLGHALAPHRSAASSDGAAGSAAGMRPRTRTSSLAARQAAAAAAPRLGSASAHALAPPSPGSQAPPRASLSSSSRHSGAPRTCFASSSLASGREPPHSAASTSRSHLSVLPARGADADAEPALAKLERMQRERQTRRKWRRGTGIDSLVTPWGKRKEADSPAQSEAEEPAEAASGAFGEVKLAISSLPGYPIAAVRGAQHRARTLIGRGHGHDAKAHEASPAGEDDGACEFGAGGFRFGGRRRASQGVSNAPVATSGGLTCLTAASGHLADANSSVPNSAPASRINGPVLVQPQAVRGEVQDLGFELQRSLSLKQSELGAVAEESAHKQHLSTMPRSGLSDVTEQPSASPQTSNFEAARPSPAPQSPGSSSLARGQSGALRRPSVVVSPAERRPSTTPSMTLAPNPLALRAPLQAQDEGSSPGSSSANSILGGAYHDEPLGDSDGVVSEASSSDSEALGTGALDTGYESEQGELSDSDVERAVALNLDHGALSKKEARKLLREQRRATRAGSMSDGPRKLAALARGESISERVAKGVTYASKESRNRRAMEKYSPAPLRALSPPLGGQSPAARFAAGMAERQHSPGPPSGGFHHGGSTTALGASISRSGTPLALSTAPPAGRDSRASSRRSSLSEGADEAASRMLSPTISERGGGGEPWSAADLSRPRRWDTSKLSLATADVQSVKSSRSRFGSRSAKRFLSLRRGHKGGRHDVQEEDADESPREEDVDQELDRVLGKLAAQEVPEQLGERYEYDVLYENQRGLLVFAIPKFSARTLFQWDPSPWTNARNGNSAYNIVNAQLPDPSWEWVHPEWLIDMSGDVDEAGWEYARNFGRLRMFPHLRRNGTALPRANARGALEMNQRIADETKKRNAKEEQREDHGIEALKRSAKSRSAKWSGQGDPGTFVRRRRWIRLRRRKALAIPSAANTPRVGTPGSMASGDWTKLAANRGAGEQLQHAKLASDDLQSSTSEDDSGDFSDLEEDEVDSEGHEVGQTPSDFFPRRTPGNLANHSDDPLRARRSKAQERRQRHAREFTGTVRELKSLLPSIMQAKPVRPHHSHTNSLGGSPLLGDRARLWRDEIDARNPFLSWKFVKKRLEDDDLAFATASLRARDRKHAQRMKEREERAQARAATRRLPSSFAPPTAEAPAPEIEAAGFSPPPRSADLSVYDPLHPPSRAATHELTRDALVEINFRRVLRVLRACKIDRQRLQLWRMWLGAEAPEAASARAEDLADLGLALSPSVKEEGAVKSREQLASQARARWSKGASLPDPMDVWDVLERRLDAVLLLFEFQGSRASLIRLLLTLHASSHPEHRFRRTSWSLPVGIDGHHVQPNAPPSLDPAAGGRAPAGASAGSHGVPRIDQRETGVPRLEFWSDLSRVAASILQAPPPGVAAHDAQSLRDEAELLRSPSRGVVGLDSPHFGPSRPRSPLAPVPLSRPPSRANTPQQATSAAARRSSASVRSASPAQGGAGPRRTAPGRSSLHLQQQGEADRAFLKELLQLPESRRGEALLSSQASAGATASSSSTQS